MFSPNLRQNIAEKVGAARGKLAGKYSGLLSAAADNPYGAISAGAGGAGLLAAGGSVLGNVTDQEQGEGPMRIITEAVNAGLAAAPLGAIPAYAAGAFGMLARPGMMRAAINKAGSAKKAKEAFNELRTGAALSMAAIPAAAGLGGLMGGATSNLYNAMGVPGFAPGLDPESYGSSNSEGARYKVPTTQYM